MTVIVKLMVKVQKNKRIQILLKQKNSAGTERRQNCLKGKCKEEKRREGTAVNTSMKKSRLF